MKILMMFPAMLILIGIALLFARLLKVKFGEGMFLSVSAVIGLLFISGAAGTFAIGMGILAVMGITGLSWNLVSEVRGRNFGQTWNQPVFWILVLVFLYGVIFFFRAPIQHIDELHLWAVAVRYMEEENHLVNWTEVGIGGQFYAASFFQLFFQKFTGYSEQGMYAASFLMSWVGLLLPFAHSGKEERKTVFLYSLILYLSLYSLYIYPYKALYTDLATAAWAGGLAGWWMNRDPEKKKQNRILLVAGLITLAFLKSYVGFLMVALDLLFIAMEAVISDRRFEDRRFVRKWSFLLCLFLVCAAAAAGAAVLFLCKKSVPGFLPDSVRTFVSVAKPSLGKAKRVIGALGNAFLGKKLSNKSNLSIFPAYFILLNLALIWLGGKTSGEEKKAKGGIVYILSATFIYMLFLVAAYICLFNYEEAIKARGVGRYFTTLMIFDLILSMTMWIRQADGRRVRYGLAALVLFFSWGINDSFLSQATSFNRYQIGGSEDIDNANAQVKEVKKQIGEDRVFFLNQSQANEYPQNIAFYNLGKQVSNYINEPWRFTPDGCEIRIQEYDSPVLENLPDLLKEGGYQYLWIYSSDEYLDSSLKKVLPISGVKDGILEGRLYKVHYGADGRVDELEFAKQLSAREA